MRGFLCSLVGLCLWGWLWDQLPQNRIPPSVLIYRVQTCVPLTLHTLSPDFLKSSEFYWLDAVQIDFPAYYFFTFIPVFWRGSQQNLGKERKLKEKPGILVHRQSLHMESSAPQPKIPGFYLSLDTRARGAGCGQLLAPQNSQGEDVFPLAWHSLCLGGSAAKCPLSYSKCLGRVSDTC